MFNRTQTLQDMYDNHAIEKYGMCFNLKNASLSGNYWSSSGSSTSLEVMKCNQEDNPECKSPEEIDEFLDNAVIYVSMFVDEIDFKIE